MCMQIENKFLNIVSYYDEKLISQKEKYKRKVN